MLDAPMTDCPVRFDVQVAPGGYIWWYVDALTDDGRQGLSIIAFIGSVFSPYYAWSSYKRPHNHVAINVALYSRRKCRWAMTERDERRLDARASSFAVGPSRLEWDGEGLSIHIDEVTAPIPERLRGVVRLRPEHVRRVPLGPLDPAGRHRWAPIAPSAHVEVDLPQPGVHWKGHGYFDSNAGDEPLYRAFHRWDWSRARLADGSTLVLYDMTYRGGGRNARGERYGLDGAVEPIPALPTVEMPRPRWRMLRRTQTDGGAEPEIVQTVEDGPFYARSILSTPVLGERVLAMHESVDLDKHRNPAVLALLPWRMPRRFWFR